MADRVGVINKGALILVEQKEALMKRFGKKQLTLHLEIAAEPRPGRAGRLGARAQGRRTGAGVHVRWRKRIDIPTLLQRVGDLGIEIGDLQTHQSSLEDIFVSLVSERA